MNTIKTIKALAFAALSLVTPVFATSCSFADECPMQEASNAKQIEFGVSMAMGRTSGIDSDALTKSNPFHVVAYVADKEGRYTVRWFEDNAYCDMDGSMHWVNGIHNWPGSGVKFVAYWPAAANVSIDVNGNVTAAGEGTVLVAETTPVNHLSSDLSLFFVPVSL